jgi:tRNA(Ile2)-agmatinylcytidine synthase
MSRKLMITLHIGLDDTDSPQGGCTTYLAALITERIKQIGGYFLDYPYLIRLNPNVPWKTRGNGAISLRIKCNENVLQDIIKDVIHIVKENSDFSCEETQPGIVFLYNAVHKDIESFSKNTICGIVKKDMATKLIKKYNGSAYYFNGGRGIIGGLAAIGERLREDYTYELITYRFPESRGTVRRVNLSSIQKMERKYGNLLFNNIDPETGRILITPRGPDPILYGIRGETSEVLRKAHKHISTDEPIERWLIFKTNQGTDAHLTNKILTSEVKPYYPATIKGRIVKTPRIIQGGHVIFHIKDKAGLVNCAAYKQTGSLAEISKLLETGDFVEVSGGVRPSFKNNPETLNLEKIRIIEIIPTVSYHNPFCPLCGRRAKSLGRGQGFECKKCHFHGHNLEKQVEKDIRLLEKKIYVTSPRSQRHLTKPLRRYGLEKNIKTKCSNKIIQYSYFSSL